jgi:hypothetical protein
VLCWFISLLLDAEALFLFLSFAANRRRLAFLEKLARAKLRYPKAVVTTGYLLAATRDFDSSRVVSPIWPWTVRQTFDVTACRTHIQAR